MARVGREVLASNLPEQTLCDWARTLTGAAYTSFVEPNAEGDLELTAQSGAALPGLTVSLDELSLVGTAYLTGHMQMVRDYKAHPEALARVVDVLGAAGLGAPSSAAYLPVRTMQETLGVVCLLLDEPFVAQTTTVLALVGMLGSEAALAIDRDRLRRTLER